MYNPVFLNSGMSKDELREKYIKLYEDVYRKLERVDSGFAAQVIYMQEELLNLYRVLWGRKDVREPKKLRQLQYEIQELKQSLKECREAIEELKSNK